MEEKELLDEVPRIVKEAYVEHMIDELIKQQEVITQEINDYKTNMNKHVNSLERHLLVINETITKVKTGWEDLKYYNAFGGKLPPLN
ncbi:MAG: hypothetical protein WBB47_12255 [Paenisporosarcina sp.]